MGDRPDHAAVLSWFGGATGLRSLPQTQAYSHAHRFIPRCLAPSPTVYCAISDLLMTVTAPSPNLNLDALNSQFERATAQDIVTWSGQTFGSGAVMSTSFGIQAAVMLHLVTSIIPNIPVIWIDTGYLPPETYRFAEDLQQRLRLNLKVYQSTLSPARMEALYGKLWEQKDLEALNRYDQIRKVEPMQRAIQDLKATAWLAGLRSNQTQHRRTLNFVNRQGDLHKILPILNWNAKDIYDYLMRHNLPYHPFFDLGYTTVGDWHSSRPLMDDDTHERDTRFQGMKQECGLHLPQTAGEAESLDSSSL